MDVKQSFFFPAGAGAVQAAGGVSAAMGETVPSLDGLAAPTSPGKNIVTQGGDNPGSGFGDLLQSILIAAPQNPIAQPSGQADQKVLAGSALGTAANAALADTMRTPIIPASFNTSIAGSGSLGTGYTEALQAPDSKLSLPAQISTAIAGSPAAAQGSSAHDKSAIASGNPGPSENAVLPDAPRTDMPEGAAGISNLLKSTSLTPPGAQTPVIESPVAAQGVTTNSLADSSTEQAAVNVAATATVPNQASNASRQSPGDVQKSNFRGVTGDPLLQAGGGISKTEPAIKENSAPASPAPDGVLQGDGKNTNAATATGVPAGAPAAVDQPIQPAGQPAGVAMQLPPDGATAPASRPETITEAGNRPVSSDADLLSLRDNVTSRPSDTSGISSTAAAKPNMAGGEQSAAGAQNFAQTLSQMSEGLSAAAPVAGNPEVMGSEAGVINPLERSETARTGTPPAPLRGETPHQPASPPIRDIAIHISQHADSGINRFQLRLDPPELGRVDVRMEISPEGKLTAVIAVERPETLDLLQRDQRILERSLMDAGLKTDTNSLSFSLKDGRNDGRQEAAPHVKHNAENNPVTDDWNDSAVPMQSAMRFANSAVNIRI